MAARTFEDSAGTSWEVFEVARSTRSQGVSVGLEAGWLAFVSDTGKRRLAPFPSDWHAWSPADLEQLCTQARPANRSGELLRDPSAAETGSEAPRTSVHASVRDFARHARERRLPAIEAMLQLRLLLAERYSGEGVSAEMRAQAGDRKQVRQWFVEAFYFERTD